jgi:PTS system cellobiose-specific IIC component
MQARAGFLNRVLMPLLTALSDNIYMSAIRSGMVSVVPLTIIGGLFMVIANLPVSGWEERMERYLPLLNVPITATFGLLSVFACFGIAYDLGKRMGQEAFISASMATLVFLMIQIDMKEQVIQMERLGSQGLFTAVLVALVSVRVQKLMADLNLVVRMPDGVPEAVRESFLSLTPMITLVGIFWVVRFVLGFDINEQVQQAFKPLLFALSTLPGILVYALLVTLLWSMGINGDNALDAIVLPFFLQYLAANVEAAAAGQPLPYITANGFFTTFVNVGGTGATIGLALVLVNSRDAAFRKVSRMSIPTQMFQINEPIMYGLPILLNPIFMIPFVINALILTAGSYLLMDWGWIRKPFINVPWTTPPVIGHYLATGGDWRAAVWGAGSIVMAMLVYYPFARVAERRRMEAPQADVPTP